MKKLFFLFFFVFPSLIALGQITVNSSGNVIIGPDDYVTGNNKLYINGLTSIIYDNYPPLFDFIPNGLIFKARLNGYPTAWVGNLGTYDNPWSYIYYQNITQRSDIKSKENIRALDSSLNKIKLLKPVKYDYKKDFFPDLSVYPQLSKTINSQDRFNRAGLIAQEAKEVIPQIVHHDEDKDIYGIDYVALVPYLIGAVQEQQTQIESLQNIITSYEQELIKVKDFIGYTEAAIKKSTTQDPLANTTGDNVPILYQNMPNPFFDITIIKVFLPGKV